MKSISLKRTLSLPVLALFGIGNILGAGIYVLIGKVAGSAGYSTPLAFVIAMIVAGLTAFSYMELSAKYPKSAGSALYVYKAFKQRWLATLIGLILVLSGVASSATLALGFAGYLNEIIGVPPTLSAVFLIIVLCALVLTGVSESARVAVLFTIIEISGLLLIIYYGFWAGRVSINSSLMFDDTVGLGGLMVGAFLAFYAFIGFEDIVSVAEEVKKPKRSVPTAIVLSLLASSLLYIIVVVVSLSYVSPDQLSGSNAPLNLVMANIGGIDSKIISVIALVAALNGVIVQLIMGSRILYGMSMQGWVPRLFSVVQSKSKTPINAVLLTAAFMIVGILFLPLVSLAKLTSFLVLSIFCLVNGSLLRLKSKSKTPVNNNTISVPYVIPLLGLLTSGGMVIYQLVELLN